MAGDFSDLVERMRSCTICDKLPLGPRPIFQLNPKTNILIAGQAPGRIAHEKGVPFDDPSGDRLRDWLGVDRATFYEDVRIGIFPMGLCFPGSNKGGDMPPREECAPEWRAQVLAKLKHLQLTVVIGRYAIDWHLPSLRGQSVTHAVDVGSKIAPDLVVLPHPSPRNNRWLRNNPWFERHSLPQLRSKIGLILN